MREPYFHVMDHTVERPARTHKGDYPKRYGKNAKPATNCSAHFAANGRPIDGDLTIEDVFGCDVFRKFARLRKQGPVTVEML